MDKQTFEALAEQYRSMIYRIALNQLRSISDAEDVMQDALSGIKLSPSVFLKCTQTQGGTYDPNAPIFKCPACGSVRMTETKEAVACPDCGRVYPIVDGIYNFRLE